MEAVKQVLPAAVMPSVVAVMITHRNENREAAAQAGDGQGNQGSGEDFFHGASDTKDSILE
ncbi:hypothetical protein [Dechloromonas sp. A34]|uniref:hypothetical protein n=1 Tax=Dechloromonas sp. A34 TaxID=447588 RepID=UPI0022487A61|nr:hypothetical protein [Dechloromonas sp. A34]